MEIDDNLSALIVDGMKEKLIWMNHEAGNTRLSKNAIGALKKDIERLDKIIEIIEKGQFSLVLEKC